MLERVRAKGIKLRADKCVFVKEEVRYLGRLISKDGYRADPEDTKALNKFRTAPKNVGELRSLLGFLGYFRCYVQDFAKKAKPLYNLLKGPESESQMEGVKKTMSRGKARKRVGQKYDSRERVEWTSECQDVVDRLIDHLQSSEVIAYPDWDLPFFLNCDASNLGLGAVLYQTQNGVDRVISYASRKLFRKPNGITTFILVNWSFLVCIGQSQKDFRITFFMVLVLRFILTIIRQRNSMLLVCDGLPRWPTTTSQLNIKLEKKTLMLIACRVDQWRYLS